MLRRHRARTSPSSWRVIELAATAIALLAFAASARASIDPETRTRMLRPRLVAPAAGERQV